MKKISLALAGIIVLTLAGFGSLTFYKNYKNTQIGLLQKQPATNPVTTNQKPVANKPISQSYSEAVLTQDQPLPTAVAKVAPSVVSIVVSKNVPKVEVRYENPFANDPTYQGINIQVPVYHQTGTQSEEVGAGSGFIVRSDGYILTNKHVVSDTGATYTALLSTGVKKTATVIYRDPDNDLAIIKIDGSGYPTVIFGDSSKLVLGQTVAAIGNALGEYSNSVSVGIVSGLNRTIDATDESGGSGEKLTGVIQTDAAINPGNSGGPLLDLSGNVVGINVATVSGSNNIAFSIPINDVKSTTAKILNI